MRRPLATILLAAIPAGIWADELTPSGDAAAHRADDAATSATSGPKLSFEAASKKLQALYPIRIERMDQVIQAPHNWAGKQDASLALGIGFTNEAAIIKAELLDDIPFLQYMEHPAAADWWRIRYGADGIEVLIDDITSATRRVRFAVNFGSGATRPKIEILQSLTGTSPGFSNGADLRVYDGPTPADADTPMIHVDAAIPLTELAPVDFFVPGKMRITVRLHDLDGPFSSYCMLQEVIETR